MGRKKDGDDFGGDNLRIISDKVGENGEGYLTMSSQNMPLTQKLF